MSFGEEQMQKETQNTENDEAIEEVLSDILVEEQSEEQTKEEVLPENSDVEETMDVAEKVAVLEAQLDAISAERDKFKDEYVRAHAEMENIRRRERKDSEQRVVNAMSSLSRDLLVVADTFTRALQSLPSKEEIEANYDTKIKNMIIGIEMTEKELHNSLEKNGIKKIPSLGKPFDPHLHQVVQEIEHDADAGVIVQELQAGYTIKDKLLREAMVVVSKGGGVKPVSKEIPDSGGSVDTMV
jgi:molecular chaperone GrpE